MDKILTIAILTLSGCASLVDLEYGERFWTTALGTAGVMAERDLASERANVAPQTIIIEQEKTCTPTYNRYGQTGCVW